MASPKKVKTEFQKRWEMDRDDMRTALASYREQPNKLEHLRRLVDDLLARAEKDLAACDYQAREFARALGVESPARGSIEKFALAYFKVQRQHAAENLVIVRKLHAMAHASKKPRT
jgi:hypothetical protein